MAALVIQRKLDSLHHCLDRIRARCPETSAALEADMDLQDIVVVDLNRAVQLCVDMSLQVLGSKGQLVPDTMADTFQKLAQQQVLDQGVADRLGKAVGFRNLAVHNYAQIRWEIVHAIATKHLQDFEAFARAVLVWTDEPR